MRASFSFRVGKVTVRVGRLEPRRPGFPPYRQIQVIEPGLVVEEGQCGITDARKLRRAYRRAYR